MESALAYTTSQEKRPRFIYNELLLTATVTEMVAEYIQRRKTLLNNLVLRAAACPCGAVWC